MKRPIYTEYRIERKWDRNYEWRTFATVNTRREARAVLLNAAPGMRALAERGGKMRVVKVTETICD